jgi:crossover junction endodeoxyribonuclease RuvC
VTIRVLGIDPGLTRCGVGIVDVDPNRVARLVEVTVIRTPADMPLEQRLLAVGTGIEELLDRLAPDEVSLERVFAQQNLSTVMGTAQVSGVALHAAAKRGLAVGLHTPSEVKAAITGYGSADKKQVQAMVARVLGRRRGRPRDRHLPRVEARRRLGTDRHRADPSAGCMARRRACRGEAGGQP